MDQRQLDEAIDKLTLSNQHEKAQEILDGEYAAAKKTGDKQRIDFILERLLFVCSTSDPPHLAAGRQFCREREDNLPSAFNALQTALFEYFVTGSYANAVKKLEEAKLKGEQEGDSRTTYTVLGHLGRAALERGQEGEAANILTEIEQMFLEGRPFVIGDETVFLETAFRKDIERETVSRIATGLAPYCRDSEYKRRLEALAR